VFETNVPPRFRLYFYNSARQSKVPSQLNKITVETVRSDGARQSFSFAEGNSYLEAMVELPEPHEFDATLTIAHGDHAHTFDFKFSEDDHRHEPANLADGDYQDAHERAHASAIARRFSNRTVSTAQIVFFGLTGGLLPCPAALTVLLLCLQLKKFTLGFTLVLCFSLGLALTMVIAGALAAWSVQHASRRFKGFGELARKAPYVSSALLVAMGLLFAVQGWRHLP
ncbi:MAG: nickel/cobalt efflux transporter, partial [Opitutaceae bacterium]|jgi:nickel/cobalt exporter